jgi:hypothetical protein
LLHLWQAAAVTGAAQAYALIGCQLLLLHQLLLLLQHQHQHQLRLLLLLLLLHQPMLLPQLLVLELLLLWRMLREPHCRCCLWSGHRCFAVRCFASLASSTHQLMP